MLEDDLRTRRLAVLETHFQSEVDRIQLIGKFKGVFFGVSWDFANKGYIADPVSDIQAIPRDASRLDDTRQWSFLIARRVESINREKLLKRGKWVVKKHTASHRLSRSLRRVREWCRFHRHDPVGWQHNKLSQKLNTLEELRRPAGNKKN